MNTGMQDAFNLGWKLKLLTSSQGDAEAIAESYFAERHRGLNSELSLLKIYLQKVSPLAWDFSDSKVTV